MHDNKDIVSSVRLENESKNFVSKLINFCEFLKRIKAKIGKRKKRDKGYPTVKVRRLFCSNKIRLINHSGSKSIFLTSFQYQYFSHRILTSLLSSLLRILIIIASLQVFKLPKIPSAISLNIRESFICCLDL